MEERRIEFEPPIAFPMAVFNFRNYDGGKALALLLFVLATVYFLSGLKNVLFWEDSWWKPDFVMKLTYFLYHLLVFTLVYCLTWLVFDKRGIEGYALAIFSTLLGIIYVLSPIDFVPEAIPLVGSFDDVIIGIGSVCVGMKGYYNNKQKSDNHQDIIGLVEVGKNEEALRMYLKQNGYKITRQA